MKENIIKALCVSGMIVSLALFTTGCTKDTVSSDPGNGTDTTTNHTSTNTPDIDDTNPGEMTSIDDKGNTGSGSGSFRFVEGRTHEGMLPIYFDFDSPAIRADQKARIEGNAEFMKANPNYKITIEGNTDDRGTAEYNIALGVKRAEVAKTYMMNLGVSGNRIYVTSYGEVKPLLFDQDEYSWSQNRRDDFVIQ